ncbi:MAG TPA: glycoside hydrolase [Dehalococcoidia bacterium]|nr:glycoside hydrolase [Dehalococcoidia bacterium]
MKKVYVILAFHAHEPIWELTQRLLENVDDMDLRQALQDENWLLKRSAEGRDIYLELVNFARGMNIPVALEITNELLIQIATFMPKTLNEIKKAYQERFFYPVYGYAHHTHIALLTETEIEDEIRLNREYIHDILQVPQPIHSGLFPIEGSIDSSKLAALKRSGIVWVIFPNFDQRKAYYKADGNLNEEYEPFLIFHDIIALPRHFAVSQHIWRPITKWKTEGVKSQGYILGRYWVLPEEYQHQQFVQFPISREVAISEYEAVLYQALKGAPDKGLILYIQDLELMDFGDVALDIMRSAWTNVIEQNDIKVNFVTPDQYLDEIVLPQLDKLKHVRFHQVSWAPEIRLVLRYDGHYPPLEAGEFRGIDATKQIFRPLPFIFWEPGRYIAELVNALLATFGLSQEIPATAAQLNEANYDFGKLPTNVQILLHSRIIKRACNWGWFPNEGLQKRPFIHGYCLADLLFERLETSNSASLRNDLVLVDNSSFYGLERILEVIIDTRCSYLTEALVKLSLKSGWEYTEAFEELDLAYHWRREATKFILRAQHHSERLRFATGGRFTTELRHMLFNFREYCRAVFISIDRIQRTWVKAGDVDTVLTAMYEYLYRLYPPKFPAILQSTLSEEELEELKKPKLR